MKKIFWALAAILLSAVIYEGMLFITSDSERIIENPLKEDTFNFNASAYPVVIDKAKYPELSAFEKNISEEYESSLQAFAESFKQYGYECMAGPEVSELSFNHLKPKQSLYMIESICGVPGDTLISMPNMIFYISQESVVMFYPRDAAAHFTEAFNKMESPDELQEYAEQYVDELDADLDSAINNSLLGDVSSADFIKDCPPLSEIPKLDSTVSKEEDSFVYEGLKIEPELHAELYYLKYSVTPDGQAVKEKEDLLAMCRNIGIIY